MHLHEHLHAEPSHEAAAPAIDVRDVRVQLGGQPVLRGVNLRVAAGQLIALIGPNGSGKTTLLRICLANRTFGRPCHESATSRNGSNWNAASS